jgi:hypothetical protein
MEDGDLRHVSVLSREGLTHCYDMPLWSYTQGKYAAHIAILLEELHFAVFDVVQGDMVPDRVDWRILRHELGIVTYGPMDTESMTAQEN